MYVLSDVILGCVCHVLMILVVVHAENHWYGVSLLEFRFWKTL